MNEGDNKFRLLNQHVVMQGILGARILGIFSSQTPGTYELWKTDGAFASKPHATNLSQSFGIFNSHERLSGD
jgi:hypothetical protein